jgi:hypothetical protein
VLVDLHALPDGKFPLPPLDRDFHTIELDDLNWRGKRH